MTTLLTTSFVHQKSFAEIKIRGCGVSRRWASGGGGELVTGVGIGERREVGLGGVGEILKEGRQGKLSGEGVPTEVAPPVKLALCPT